MNQYMFNTREITPRTAHELSEASDHGALICKQVPGYPNVWKYTEPDTLNFCYVYADEAGQFSNPYPTAEAAYTACLQYFASL